MTTETTGPDLITEVDELLAGWRPSEIVKQPEQVRELLRRLVEEVKRTRQFGCEHCDCSCTNCGPCGEKLP